MGFCGPEHAHLHRPEQFCFPFMVEMREGVGRWGVSIWDQIQRKFKDAHIGEGFTRLVFEIIWLTILVIPEHILPGSWLQPETSSLSSW